jgi:predicted membrane protein
MKTITVLVAVWLCIGTAKAQQKTEKHINFSGKDNISIKIEIADSISIHTWNKDEVFVSASVNINDNKDNQAYLISFDEPGNCVDISGNFEKNYFRGKNNCCNESDIYWQIFMPENAAFDVETINGNMTVDGKTNQMKIKSISGDIDLTVPGKRQADVEFSTISGRIYSNHDFSIATKKTSIPLVIRDQLNNGGSKIILETISGDIFFRKGI